MRTEQTLSKLDNELDANLTPMTLTEQYKEDDSTDFLVIAGKRFQMSSYSMDTVSNSQQSRYVEYRGCGVVISLDFELGTIEIYESILV